METMIDVTDIVKICKKHGNLTFEEVHKSSNSIRCKYCRLEQRKKWRDENLEKHRKNVSEYKKNNRDKVNEAYRYYYQRKKEKYGSFLNIQSKCGRVGITVENYFKILEEQNNLCAICNEPETRKRKTEDGEGVAELCLDHCHETNKFRALLCHGCNTAIGQFKDNIELLESAIRYLNKHK